MSRKPVPPHVLSELRVDPNVPRAIRNLPSTGTKPTSMNAPSVASAAAAIPATSSADFRNTKTVRHACLGIIESKFPDFRARNDYEILVLASGLYNPLTDGDIQAWLDSATKTAAERHGALEIVLARTKEILDTVSVVTGTKPAAGTLEDPECGVFAQAIPHTAYSIRLFPGSFEGREWCMDFVRTADGMPANSPFECSLLSVPGSSTPSWLSAGGVERLFSLERSFGIRQEEIPLGEEKWVLRDGQTCVLEYKYDAEGGGQMTARVRFMVPNRVPHSFLGNEIPELRFPNTA